MGGAENNFGGAFDPPCPPPPGAATELDAPMKDLRSRLQISLIPFQY